MLLTLGMTAEFKLALAKDQRRCIRPSNAVISRQPNDEIGFGNRLGHRDHLLGVRHVELNLLVQPRVFRRFGDLQRPRQNRRCAQCLRARALIFRC
jgi:hypothetical protein